MFIFLSSLTFFFFYFIYLSIDVNRIVVTDLANDLVSYQSINLIVDECMNGNAVWTTPDIRSSSLTILVCVCNELFTGNDFIKMHWSMLCYVIYVLGTFCEKSINCDDINACVLNFKNGTSCRLNASTTNITRAPYLCLQGSNSVPCTNDSECCNDRYYFDMDVQQCLCK